MWVSPRLAEEDETAFNGDGRENLPTCANPPVTDRLRLVTYWVEIRSCTYPNNPSFVSPRALRGSEIPLHTLKNIVHRESHVKCENAFPVKERYITESITRIPQQAVKARPRRPVNHANPVKNSFSSSSLRVNPLPLIYNLSSTICLPSCIAHSSPTSSRVTISTIRHLNMSSQFLHFAFFSLHPAS